MELYTTYTTVLLITCGLNVLLGLPAKPRTHADDLGKWSFVALFQATVFWGVFELIKWVTP